MKFLKDYFRFRGYGWSFKNAVKRAWEVSRNA